MRCSSAIAAPCPYSLIEEKPKRIQKRSSNMAGIRINYENGLTSLDYFDIIIMVVWTSDPTNH